MDRWESVSAPHGAASLRYTHWLDAVPRTYEGVDGEWWAEDGRVRSAGVDLAPFESVERGELLLRAFVRDDALALRVYDPANPARTELRGIESFPVSDEWVLTGRFEPAAEGEEHLVRSVDGYERTVAATGTVVVSVQGHEMRLQVSGSENLFAVIADTGTGGYPFRFVEMDAPDATGAVTLDLNTAYLPPCAFSDQYVCPLPPPQNRFPFPVTAGEHRALR